MFGAYLVKNASEWRSHMFDIIIVGGGAAGMMAAITAARNGASVCILERKERLGKKILATGNGKCNYTNQLQHISCYRGSEETFIKAVLTQFPMEETVAFFKEIGIYPKERNGYFYPHSEQAASVADALEAECKMLGVQIYLEQYVTAIKQEKRIFCVSAKNKEQELKQYKAYKLILAAGGMAAKVHGSDGSGYTLAKQLGHSLVKPLPAIVQLKAQGSFFKTLAGVRTEGHISLWIDEKKVTEEFGELMFTAYGLSGIPVMQVSRFAAEGLANKKTVIAKLDLFPELQKQALYDEILRRFERAKGKHTYEQALVGLLNHKLNYILLKEAGFEPTQTPSGKLKEATERFVKQVKQFTVPISDTNGFDNAQACAGGVSTKELTSQMESKLVPGLYIVGELADVDGTCGGYNLQWAWSSGYVAGYHAAQK